MKRFIRTLKLPIFERRKALGGNWAQYVEPVVEKYNDSIHSSTNQKPSVLAEHQYDYPVLEKAYKQLSSQAKFPVKHEYINEGDYVKIRVKSSAFYKETFNSWSSDVYVVSSVEDGPDGEIYRLEGYRRPLLRFELKKVSDVQRVVHGSLQSVLNQVKRPGAAPEVAPSIAAPAVVRPPPPPARRPITRSVSAAVAAAPAAPVLAPVSAVAAFRRPITRSQTSTR